MKHWWMFYQALFSEKGNRGLISENGTATKKVSAYKASIKGTAGRNPEDISMLAKKALH